MEIGRQKIEMRKGSKEREKKNTGAGSGFDGLFLFYDCFTQYKRTIVKNPSFCLLIDE
jgi:hypothetical protein